MSPTHILLLDLNTHTCREEHCARLTQLLYGFFPDAAIKLQTLTDCSPDACTLPADLVLLRPASAQNLSEATRQLRSQWPTAALWGLFCAGQDTAATVSDSFDALDDFLCCPLRAMEVLPRLQRLIEAREQPLPPTTDMLRQLRQAGLVGESAAFLRVMRHVFDLAPCDATILLTGETGTGKELVARAVHYRSARQGKPFVPVNCGAMPDHLVENELFGHAKGAYTDASSPEQGLVDEAAGGTLFLDEVDTLSAAAQVKLLRFLQNREYRPLGCSRIRTADVRIIAATNADLGHLVQVKQFREDLYYRLHVLALRLPPLRERPEDIPLLATYLLRRYAHQHRRGALQLAADARQKLLAYAWPGNVRELETVMQRAVLLATSSLLHADDIALPPHYAGDVVETDSLRAAKARVIEQFERAYLVQLLTRHEGNITQAAKGAGKERRAFQRLLRKYNLQRYAFQT